MQRGVAPKACQNLCRIIRPIRCDVQIPTRHEFLRKKPRCRWLNQAPFVVPFLWPGIGEIDIKCSQRVIRDVRIEDIQRIAFDDANIFQLHLFAPGNKVADARDVDIDGEKIFLRMICGDLCCCFTHAEANFENNRGSAAENFFEIEQSRFGADAEALIEPAVSLALPSGHPSGASDEAANRSVRRVVLWFRHDLETMNFPD